MMIQETIGMLRPADAGFAEEAQKRLDNLTKPPGSLGRLEEFAKRTAAIRGIAVPAPGRKVIFTFACDHGVADEGVSAYPREVTRQMVLNFLRGGAAINVLARHAGADVVIVDIGVDFDFTPLLAEARYPVPLRIEKIVRGTKNMRRGPAMARREAERSIEVGIALAREYAEKGYTIFGAGEMGIANTTPSSAIAAVLTGRTVPELTGRGTGIDDDALGNKIRVIEESIAINRPDPNDGIDVLSKVGGAEIGGIAGLIIGAAACRVPVVIDGFISTAGALIAHSLAPLTKDYMFAAHTSVETGHRAMLEKIGLSPILDLGMRLGEGTGAALAMQLLDAGLKICREMATFGEAGVSGGGES
ncbi:MAG: nicotinate-nucleotide--dimethylbenzimidazole phosphoribosyltransferase [Nitrospiraceae bacterium]|nr:nicotinate-nucleotide--dimethylbenzimidazole phosphoribosyltransferase [Nitrospiraceae bacterium]